MNQPELSTNSGFTELGETPREQSGVPSSAGNVLRNRQFLAVHFDELRNESAKQEPIVNIRRNGNDIESIEFVCRCGCTKTVRFDYDAE